MRLQVQPPSATHPPCSRLGGKHPRFQHGAVGCSNLTLVHLVFFKRKCGTELQDSVLERIKRQLLYLFKKFLKPKPSPKATECYSPGRRPIQGNCANKGEILAQIWAPGTSVPSRSSEQSEMRFFPKEMSLLPFLRITNFPHTLLNHSDDRNCIKRECSP